MNVQGLHPAPVEWLGRSSDQYSYRTYTTRVPRWWLPVQRDTDQIEWFTAMLDELEDEKPLTSTSASPTHLYVQICFVLSKNVLVVFVIFVLSADCLNLCKHDWIPMSYIIIRIISIILF